MLAVCALFAVRPRAVSSRGLLTANGRSNIKTVAEGVSDHQDSAKLLKIVLLLFFERPAGLGNRSVPGTGHSRSREYDCVGQLGGTAAVVRARSEQAT
jgi:hypothetical protein